MIGRGLAHFRVLEKIGEGGMGQVYLAEDTTLDRRVALKVLLPDVAADPEHLERFRREMKAVAAINHPGIVAVHSVGEADGLHFFAMEHVAGRSLADCIPGRGFPLAEFMELALPVTEALEAAHGAGVVHRDLKPGNVMITEEGGVKVLDFGLAKMVSRESRGSGRPLTSEGALVGTITYMAPEQIRGDSVDERTDLFALGVLFYEMATGRHPFDTRNVGNTLMSILHDRPRLVSALKPTMGTGLDPIVARCLEKEPHRRHDNATELREALEELLRGARDRTVAVPIGGADGRERRSPSRPRIWSLPRQRNRNFCGLDEELAEARRLLGAEQRGVSAIAVVGLGGIGKTDFAVEFAYRHAGDYETVWWLPADDPVALKSRYAALGQELGQEPRRDIDRTVAKVRDELGRQEGWLLVFDNAEELSGIREYLPPEAGEHVLVTSRNPAWRGLGEVLELSAWSADRAATFLERRTGDTDREAARQLNAVLGGLPLALEHAAAYIETSGQTAASYLRLFAEHRQLLLSKVAKGASSPASVMATWDLSFRRVGQDSPAAEQLLHFCAFLAPDDIPLELLRTASELLPEPLRAATADDLLLDEVLTTLLRYSLVSRLEESFSMHRLVQLAVRQALAEDGLAWAEVALRAVSAAFPEESNLQPEVWPRCARLLPHAVSGIQRVGDLAPNAVAVLLDSVGTYLTGRGQYSEARSYLERSLTIEAAVHGPDHPRVAMRLNSLGRVWNALGDLRQALALFEHSLSIVETVRGPEHVYVAQRLNNVATVLIELGRPAKARQLLQRALKIEEAARGLEDPRVGHRLSNLAITYVLSAKTASNGERRRDLKHARALFDRALRIYESSFGVDHLLVGKTAMNIGSLLIDCEELSGAQRWLERAIAVLERILDPGHPELALCLKNLGELHHRLGDFAGARACLHRALEIEEEAFGGRHHHQGRTFEQLGLLASAEGSEEEARLCLERALSILEDTVGAQHRDTVRVRKLLEDLPD